MAEGTYACASGLGNIATLDHFDALAFVKLCPLNPRPGQQQIAPLETFEKMATTTTIVRSFETVGPVCNNNGNNNGRHSRHSSKVATATTTTIVHPFETVLFFCNNHGNNNAATRDIRQT